MDLFIEFLVTIAVALLFSFFIAKKLSSSSSTNFEFDRLSGLKPCKELIGKEVTCELKLEAESKRDGSDGEIKTGFVANVVEVDKSDGPKQEKILVEEFLNESSGSCDDVDKREVPREVEGEYLIGKFMEEDLVKFGDACECEENLAVGSTESEIVAKFETDLSREDVGVATSEEVEALESKCENETGEEDGSKNSVFVFEEILVDKSNDGVKIAMIETELSKNKMGLFQSEEIGSLHCECDNKIGEVTKNEAEAGDVKKPLFDEDDDWEGIERTELDRLFGAAVAYVGDKSNADQISSIGSEAKMQLYGLHKIATEGPCYEPQPMALKVSARANWNAWKQLGNMTPDAAMEQYVTILSRSIPGGIQADVRGDNEQLSADDEARSKLAFDLKTYQADLLDAVDKRTLDGLMPHLEDA